MKKCPFCAEEIQDEAVKCRYCLEWLDESKRPMPIAQPPALPAKPGDDLPWFYKTGFIVLVFMMLPPAAIPLIWLRPKLHWGWKVGYSAGIVLLTVLMTVVFKMFIEHVMEMSKMLDGARGVGGFGF